MTDTADAPRLVLVTPPRAEPEPFAAHLAEALDAGDVAAVLIAGDVHGRDADELAARLVPVVQSAGAAALIADDTRLAGRVKADGVHITAGLDDLRLAVGKFGSKLIVGMGNVTSRHAAMVAGEVEPDYLFFGRPHGDTHDEPHPKALELAAWWAELTNIPAVAMAGRSLDSIARAAVSGADFVAAHDAVWAHPGGAAEAVAAAETALRRERRAA